MDKAINRRQIVTIYFCLKIHTTELITCPNMMVNTYRRVRTYSRASSDSHEEKNIQHLSPKGIKFACQSNFKILIVRLLFNFCPGSKMPRVGILIILQLKWKKENSILVQQNVTKRIVLHNLHVF